jgi:integrase
MARHQKNDVAIENIDGWIRLRWQYQGKRCSLRLGLPYDSINLAVAQQRVSQIRLDILSGHYDPSLVKYRGGEPKPEVIGAVELFTRFIDWKAKRVQPRTLEKYRALTVWLKDEFGDRPVTPEDAEKFLARLLENMEPITARERLALLNAAWNWGEKQGMVPGNPWNDLRVRKPPKQAPKPFTRAEVAAIVAGFSESRYYRHYGDYVRFKFGTGCRTGEVAGLRWKHITASCSLVWFGESFTHGQFKDTKTGKAREVKLSSSLATMLSDRMPEDVDADALVFTTPKGGAMDEHNFCRAWRIVLKAQGIAYRNPYNTRHTFISHALEAGMSPVEVAAITGHNVKTLFENYAGLVKSHPTTPELF